MTHRIPIADIAFLSEFAAFARAKGEEEYCASDVNACALAQFGYVGSLSSKLPQVPEAAFNAAVYGETGDGSGTFNQLADRLDALLADVPVVVM